MPKSEQTFKKLCEILDLETGNGLVFTDANLELSRNAHIIELAKSKLGANAVFFVKSPDGQISYPLIYFATLESRNNQKIAKLHRLAWNIGIAPLLFVVIPGQVLVYNSYSPPKRLASGELDSFAGLEDTLDLLASVETERQKMLNYSRPRLESGFFWEENQERFDIKKRVDQTLLENLRTIRNYLVRQIPRPEDISIPIIHSLLGRAIFVQYLEDRRDSQGHGAFPKDFFARFAPKASRFTDVLSDIQATYRLFEFLSEKFNGDIFPISEEELNCIEQRHLDSLRDFLSGSTLLPTGQMALWPLYTFDVIPIQLISHIYEQFFHVEKEELNKREGKQRNSGKAGTHYTPYPLVEFLMDEVFPWEGPYAPVRILDPACGSGVFLVEAYRRLIARWRRSNDEKRPSDEELINILQTTLYGVDLNAEAIRVAGLSLCLTICDYLEPRDIWERVKFPSLLGKNLFVADFFSAGERFSGAKFDLIIGNPPWEEALTQPALDYVKESKHPIGNKQIAQVFLWRAPELCKDSGKICLVVTSKGLLFNRSTTNIEFRRKLFSAYRVETIVNFSVLRRSLFSQAVGPAAAIFYSTKKPSHSDQIVYCCPKPSHTLQDSWGFLIEPTDINILPYDEATNSDVLWKVAMWGGPRDYELVKRLSELPTLKDMCSRYKWIYAEGFKRGNAERRVPELTGQPYVDARILERYVLKEDLLLPLLETHFECHVSTKREVFKGPHLLIKQSPKAGEGLIAAVLKGDAVFRHSLLGIHCKPEDVDKLSVCCAILNNPLMFYLSIMTSRRFLVERDELEETEILDFPMPGQLLNKENMVTLPYTLEEIATNAAAAEEIEGFVLKLYEISETEAMLIKDTLAITYDYFRNHKKSIALSPPANSEIKEYASLVCRTLNGSFINPEKQFQAVVFSGSGPLRVVALKLSESQSDVEVLTREGLNNTLGKLDAHLLERQAQGVYVRRNVRIYDDQLIYIVKPNQKRQWTHSAALRDSDEIFAEVMQAWRYR